MAPRIQITAGLKLAACIARSHGAANAAPRPHILTDRVDTTAIVGRDDTFRLPRSTNGGVGSRHGIGVLQHTRARELEDQQSGPSEPGTKYTKYTKIAGPGHEDL